MSSDSDSVSSINDADIAEQWARLNADSLDHLCGPHHQKTQRRRTGCRNETGMHGA
jgi:hypothetical protein